MSALPSISVVIPTYNGASFIEEALQSVFAQSIAPDQIVIVDDGSTDNTLEIVKRLAESSEVPLDVVPSDVNSGGPSRPINRGVERIASDLVAVLDQDDIYLPDALENASRALANSDDCNFAFHWVADFDVPESGPRQSTTVREWLVKCSEPQTAFRVVPGNEMLTAMVRHGNFVFGYPGFVFRRSAWVQKGGVDESLRIAGDMEFLMWMCQHGNTALVDNVGYLRRVHDSNACHRTALLNSEVALVLAKRIKELPSELGSELREVAVERIKSLAYWLRESQLFAESTDIYSLLSDLGVPRTAVWTLKAKCVVCRMLNALSRKSSVDAGPSKDRSTTRSLNTIQ